MSVLRPRPVITWQKAQKIWRSWEIWQQPDSIVHRLPEFYKRHYWDTVLRDPEPVHYRRPEKRYTFDPKRKIRIEHEDNPIVPIYPPEADYGLWGGEGVLKGYRLGGLPPRPKRFLPRRWVPHLWFPSLRKELLYSEILDRYMLIMVTMRTLRLIDENQGFDYYILRTHVVDLHSKLGCKLKREMLLCLARKDFSSPERCQEMLEKYSEFVIPEKEAEWISLDLNEACRKLQDEEEERYKPIPLKEIYEKELVESLRSSRSTEGGIGASLKRFVTGK
ncbi:unnamed protein product [Soboliphyme baturini]|uniref:Large ribosomal subunit protein bL28m n=1 Tax=Soboliphyme baturini TaxID=241478 RepID=A0A183J2Q5_9BILA|nr:unnamed protein product [Soboliphyme baturini]